MTAPLSEATASRVLEIIDETESALATAAMESRAVGRIAAPGLDGSLAEALAEAMSALEDVDGEVESILLRLAAARRYLEASS